MMLPRIFGLVVGLFVTWMVFFGAGYFGGVWKHYFADEPPKSTGEVSVNIIRAPPPRISSDCLEPRECSKGSNGEPKPHE
jgi:hypothetical protein